MFSVIAHHSRLAGDDREGRSRKVGLQRYSDEVFQHSKAGREAEVVFREVRSCAQRCGRARGQDHFDVGYSSPQLLRTVDAPSPVCQASVIAWKVAICPPLAVEYTKKRQSLNFSHLLLGSQTEWHQRAAYPECTYSHLPMQHRR